jgi:mannan endo-1,4-beta-mannosidase
MLLGSLLSACSFSVASRSGSPGFVTRSGPSFEVGGKPFRFVGFNLYDAAASDVYACSPSTRLDDAALAKAMTFIHDKAGATVVRFWAYQTYTAGGTDFSGTDRVIRAARKAGLRVMPVLEDGPGDCSTGEPRVSLAQADGGTWFTQGYRRPYGTARVSYRTYARLITHHYRNNPTVVGWTMVNEAETTQRTPAGRTALVGFARDMAAVIHRADPNHLVTLGSQSNGAPGASGSDFAAIYGLKGLDFTEVHDWDRYGSDTEAMPGSVGGRLPAASSAGCRTTTAQIACSFAISRSLRKPLVVGEVGIAASDDPGRTRRAGLIRAKMIAAFHDGADGYLVWQLNTQNTDGIAVISGSTDPLFAVLRRRARTLH